MNVYVNPAIGQFDPRVISIPSSWPNKKERPQIIEVCVRTHTHTQTHTQASFDKLGPVLHSRTPSGHRT